jgi:UDP-galactopyranose mutase
LSNHFDIRSKLASTELIIVGSGFFGLTVAERAANVSGANVLVLERRSHIGGNAYSFVDPSTHIEVHKYGSHLFHTSNPRVWDYANQFTSFNDYRHRVMTIHKNKIYSMPINLATICSYYNKVLSPNEAMSLISEQINSENISSPINFEEKAISLIGRPLYESLIMNYTQKQWQTSPSELPAETIARLPIRYDFNSRYFSDTWEGLPLNGYSNWFAGMIKNQKIHVELDIDYFDIRNLIPKKIPVVYTGPIDRYFDFSAGHLGWRTLDFSIESKMVPDFQGTAVMNYADLDVAYTRIHEFKHLHPERTYSDTSTIIMKEFSRFSGKEDEPYYPINSINDRSMLLAYRHLISKEENIIFGGRLGSYKYLDMHMAIASALQVFDNEILPRLLKNRVG